MELIFKSTTDPKMPVFLKSYASENEVFVEFENDNVLYVIGTVNIKVVYGAVEVWGYTMTVNSPVTTLYSSTVHGLISITSANKQKAVASLHRSHEADKWKMFMNTYMPIFDIFNDNKHRLIPPQCIQNVEKRIGCWFDLSSEMRFIKRLIINCQWKHFTDDLLNRPIGRPIRVVVAGYKNSGKSTMVYYFINKCLQKWNSVLVLDINIGKNEFSIHGCASAFIVDKPLLGPNLTHLLQPYKSYSFGSSNTTVDINLYNKILRQILNDLKTDGLCQLPCFIKTMGFVVGTGLQILHNIISKTNPTDVIQIKFANNQLLNLHYQNVNDNIENKLCYKFWNFQSMIKKVQNKYLNVQIFQCIDKRIIRNWMITSYFSKCLRSTDTYLTDVIPYRINIKNINIIIGDNQYSHGDTLEIINANIIALCVNNNTDICECVGFGFIKCIDRRTGDIFVITPIVPNLLVRVNQFRYCHFRLPSIFYDRMHLQKSVVCDPLV